ncbi:hypothetical protein [Rhizobium sp. BK399]|uniref:hypothetical protein n=1 Tax=Rhizobium sp. BK399 TaxID=2587063 RepID=UPI00161C7020|nr:hypothetical protein [Rhizobium sp. BK399]MBB3544231.1 ElaB/YqjD/DUF883 family membrane-anchored ribosome-binding protein [Rhizobium sp. BK399]
MADDPGKSPAVQSMRKEQAQQRRRARKGELEAGLESTFPASDPVSVTHTAIPAGRTDVESAARVSTAPDAYDVGVDRSEAHDKREIVQNKFRTLRHDAVTVKDSLSGAAAGSVDVVRVRTRRVLEDIENTIRERPITAMAVVAAVAFVFGTTR